MVRIQGREVLTVVQAWSNYHFKRYSENKYEEDKKEKIGNKN
jgi:hypothetical protein